MRKLLTFFVAMFITGSMFAGGLVTNTNQSAAWVRLPSRNASVSIDAAYFNPAGLMKLENGFHVSLSNQSIFQTREIENSYAGPSGAFGINQHLYKGTVTALAFPSIYAVYKMDRLAFSIGFNPVGGGGGAEYKKGLPSFEMSPSDLVPALAARGASAYRLDAYFKGSSTFLGFQGGVSYKINDWLSIAAGLRYVTAENTYEGYLRSIELNMGGTWLKASDIFTGLAAQLTGITTIPSQLAGAIDAGAGGLTLAQLVGAGQMSAAAKTSIETALAAIGVPAANIPVMTVSQISGTVTAATPALNTQIATATATSTLVADQSADVAQKGSGITPVLSVNISPSENLNIGIKYEMATKLDLKNKTVKDLLIGYTSTGTPITMFPDGGMTRNDMPAMLSVGVDYKLGENLKVSLGTNYFFDKSADYGHKVDADLNSSTPTTHISNSDIIDDNGMSFQGGLEFNISEKLLVSGGYVWANKGVNAKYQSDLTYGLSTQTFGAGGAYSIGDNIQINLGAAYTAYKTDEKTIDHMFPSTPAVNIPAQESYAKSTFMVAIGLDFRF
jgi:long-chain fatty acid transport protein